MGRYPLPPRAGNRVGKTFRVRDITSPRRPLGTSHPRARTGPAHHVEEIGQILDYSFRWCMRESAAGMIDRRSTCQPLTQSLTKDLRIQITNLSTIDTADVRIRIVNLSALTATACTLRRQSSPLTASARSLASRCWFRSSDHVSHVAACCGVLSATAARTPDACRRRPREPPITHRPTQ